MSKSQLFIQAHILTHETVARFGGDYRVTFGAALSHLYKEEKNMQRQPRRRRPSIRKQNKVPFDVRLERAGGNRWERENKIRVYFNDLCHLAGIEYTLKPGRATLESATLNGKNLERETALKLIKQLNAGKFWYDMNESNFSSKGLDQEQFERIRSKVENRLAQTAEFE